MWFTENPLYFYIKINISIEIFEIIVFLYFPEKIILYNKKNQFMLFDDYVIIFLLATLTTTAKNTHTHSLTYNYDTLYSCIIVH